MIVADHVQYCIPPEQIAQTANDLKTDRLVNVGIVIDLDDEHSQPFGDSHLKGNLRCFIGITPVVALQFCVLGRRSVDD